jgi:hypothetical protein
MFAIDSPADVNIIAWLSAMKTKLSKDWLPSHLLTPLLVLLGASLILLPDSANSQPRQSSQSSKSDLVPTTLKVHWQSSYKSEPVTVDIEWDGKALNYLRTRTSEDPAQKAIKFSVTPPEQAWKEFWRSLDQEKVWNWLSDYGCKSDVSEGFAWSFMIARGAKSVKSSGTNSYPGMVEIGRPSDSPVMFHRLSYALDRLLARPVEVEGVYFAGFETSRLIPSTPEFKGGFWWLESNEDFNRRYASFLPKKETVPRFGGQEVLTHLKGRLVGPGHYGHLNQYDHEIIVDQVLSMKPLSSR